MSKAEDRAKDLGYWKDPLNRAEYTANDEWDAFIDGYHQAEKDLKLTWEDLKMIDEISDQVYAECDVDAFDEKEYYQEILNRFKKLR